MALPPGRLVGVVVVELPPTGGLGAAGRLTVDGEAPTGAGAGADELVGKNGAAADGGLEGQASKQAEPQWHASYFSMDGQQPPQTSVSTHTSMKSQIEVVNSPHVVPFVIVNS